MVSEAHGAVTDFRGGSFDVFGTQTLASNRMLHDAMVHTLTTRLDAAPIER
jgi:hypothetical protein